jgi:hypothetical protein
MESILPIPEQYKNRYNRLVNEGLDYLKNRKVVFATLTRNSSDRIQDNLQTFERIGSKCLDYKIIVYENDSTDNTRAVLENLVSDKIFLIGENNNSPKFGPVKSVDRIKFMTHYRDSLKKYIVDHFSDYDYVVIFDSDFINFSENGIYNSFGWISSSSDIDCIAGNSYQIRNVFGNGDAIWNYDSWAFRLSEWNSFAPSTISPLQSYSSDLWFGFFITPNGGNPFCALSAFGGCAIYKYNKYEVGKYSIEPFNDCDHVLFHHNISKQTRFNLYVNPSQIMLMPT